MKTSCSRCSCLTLFCCRGEVRRVCRALRSLVACSSRWFLCTSRLLVAKSHLSQRSWSWMTMEGGDTPLSSSLRGWRGSICIMCMRPCGKPGERPGNWGSRDGGNSGSSEPALPPLPLGPRLLPNTSTMGRGLGLPSWFSTMAGLCWYFLRWSLRLWQYLVA